MSETGLTPLDVRKHLFDIVGLVFSGLHDEDGNLKIKSGTSEFSVNEIYKAICQLSKELPELSIHYFTEKKGEIPYCKNLENILYSFGCWSLIRHGSRGHEHLMILDERVKSAIETTLKRYYSEEELRKLLPIVQRFNELIDSASRRTTTKGIPLNEETFSRMNDDERKFWENFLQEAMRFIDKKRKEGVAEPFRATRSLTRKYKEAISSHDGIEYCQVRQLQEILIFR